MSTDAGLKVEFAGRADDCTEYIDAPDDPD